VIGLGAFGGGAEVSASHWLVDSTDIQDYTRQASLNTHKKRISLYRMATYCTVLFETVLAHFPLVTANLWGVQYFASTDFFGVADGQHR